MVSFSCENCGDVLTKKKLDPHRNQCYGASFTCIDCMVHFQGTDYRSHTSCISEAQKYQGALYKGEKKGKGQGQQQKQGQLSDGNGNGHAPGNAVAIVDVPPKAPSPPPNSGALPPGIHALQFLVSDEAKKTAAPHDTTDEHYQNHGYAYGSGPLKPALERYDSYPALPEPPTPAEHLVTPAPKRDRDEKKSDKKRKRQQVDELDMSSVKRGQEGQSGQETPMLHTGLTGGLNRMLSGPDFDGGEASPISPKKRSKKEKHDQRADEAAKSEAHTKKSRHHRQTSYSSSDEQKQQSRSRKSTRTAEAQNQMVAYRSPAELFMSFVNKGPESERGMSINKVLKRYHREREIRGERAHDDKDLFKELRIRKNERGEVVLLV